MIKVELRNELFETQNAHQKEEGQMGQFPVGFCVLSKPISPNTEEFQKLRAQAYKIARALTTNSQNHIKGVSFADLFISIWESNEYVESLAKKKKCSPEDIKPNPEFLVQAENGELDREIKDGLRSFYLPELLALAALPVSSEVRVCLLVSELDKRNLRDIDIGKIMGVTLIDIPLIREGVQGTTTGEEQYIASKTFHDAEVRKYGTVKIADGSTKFDRRLGELHSMIVHEIDLWAKENPRKEPSFKIIAQKLNVSAKTVSKVYHKFEVVKGWPKKRNTKANIEKRDYPDWYYTALDLQRQEEFSIAQIALILGKNPGSVRSAVSLAAKRLGINSMKRFVESRTRQREQALELVASNPRIGPKRLAAAVGVKSPNAAKDLYEQTLRKLSHIPEVKIQLTKRRSANSRGPEDPVIIGAIKIYLRDGSDTNPNMTAICRQCPQRTTPRRVWQVYDLYKGVYKWPERARRAKS